MYYSITHIGMKNLKQYIAEMIGTFGLVLFGTGSIIVNDQLWSGWIVWIALTFGIIIIAMIYTFGKISGAHINPAVTIAFLVWKQIKLKKASFYIVAQFAGAILASILLRFLFPEHIWLWQTLPSGLLSQSLVMEIVVTFFMMLTILGVTGQWWIHTKALAWIVIGLFIIGAIPFAWPVSGWSFNPARSLGPALIAWNMSHIWLYFVWPIIWAIWAMWVWSVFKDNE